MCSHEQLEVEAVGPYFETFCLRCGKTLEVKHVEDLMNEFYDEECVRQTILLPTHSDAA
jgi:hypothetical protein